jgi:hypothetical protein
LAAWAFAAPVAGGVATPELLPLLLPLQVLALLLLLQL